MCAYTISDRLYGNFKKCSVGQKRMRAPYMIMCMVIFLLKYRTYTVYMCVCMAAWVLKSTVRCTCVCMPTYQQPCALPANVNVYLCSVTGAAWVQKSTARCTWSTRQSTQARSLAKTLCCPLWEATKWCSTYRAKQSDRW